MSPSSPVSGPDAQRAAVEELRKAEYHRDDPGPVSRVLGWLGRRLGDLFSGSVTGSAFLILVVILAVVVVFAVVRAGVPSRRAVGRQAGADPLRPQAATDHRALALGHETAGRWGEAVREWLRAAVRTVEERGLLDPRPGRTGSAVAREAGAVLPSAAADLTAATAAFDAVWFGGREATAQDAAIAHRAADAVQTARIERAARAGGYAVPR